MAEHRKHFRQYKERSRHITTSVGLFEEYGVENCKIELIEEFPCDTKEQLLKQEGHYIRHTECVNRCIAGRTRAEYMQENADAIKERKQKYRQDHADTISSRTIEYYQKNRDSLKQKSKEHYERNSESIKMYMHQYTERNKERIQEYSREKIECPKCTSAVCRKDIARHQRTAKCQRLSEGQV